LQPDFVQTTVAWLLTVLFYPGLVFAMLLVLLGEWAAAIVTPALSPRPYRSQARLFSLLEPMYTFLKLLGRREAVRWQRPGDPPVAPAHPGESALAVIGALAPVLAMCLLPLRGTPIGNVLEPGGDLVAVLLLLAVQPLAWAALRLREGGSVALRGAQDVGRLLVGLLPALLIVAALVQVSGSATLSVPGLLLAPETPQQTFVRLLAGVGLLLALPWWTTWGRGANPEQWSAGAYVGRYLQTAAVAVLWTVLVLPAPGEVAWAVAVSLLGTLFAYVAVRLVAERWMPARREADAAGLAWAAALPIAGLAFALAFWPGA
jgi:hypothetical protein